MGFLFGVAVGYFVGTMIAPRSGEETREMLADRAREALRGPAEKIEARAREAARRTEQKAGDIGSEIGRKAAESAVRSVSEGVLGDERSA